MTLGTTVTMQPLKSISAFITKGATPTTYGFKWETSGVPFLRSECVSDHGLDLTQAMFISPAADTALQRSRVREGDILMTITGYVGRVIRLQGLPSGNINQHIARIRINDEGFDPGFIYHYLSQPWIKANYEKITTGQAYPQISLTQVRETDIPVLPVDAQRKIAASLDAADNLVSSLERLIAKKRDIKQGLMQELLSGRTRLPGFEEPWRDAIWNEITERRQGSGIIKGGLSSVRTLAAPFPAYSASGQDVWSAGFDFSGDGVVISAVGSRCGKAFLAHGQWSAIANTHVVFAREAFLNAKFAHLYFNDEGFWIKGGSGQPFVQIKASLLQSVSLPPLEEQEAICRVLRDADDEIAALERRLESARAIKQGMMQELLTGRTRLAEEVAA